MTAVSYVIWEMSVKDVVVMFQDRKVRRVDTGLEHPYHWSVLSFVLGYALGRIGGALGPHVAISDRMTPELPPKGEIAPCGALRTLSPVLRELRSETGFNSARAASPPLHA